jgi:hypothetical protein
MAGPAKNASDPWLRFKVTDTQGTGVLDQFVLVEWVADLALLTGGGRTPYNSWPYDAATMALATQWVSAVPQNVFVPQDSWEVLQTYRVLYFRLSYGPGPAPGGPGWVTYNPGQMLVNHPPRANAGPPRVPQLDQNDRLIDDLRLDGSGSIDDDMAASLGSLRDPGPLAFKWEVASGQAVGALPWNTSAFTQASPIALPSNTLVGPAAIGTYTFRLRVEDTDQPLSTSSKGVDYDEVQYTIRRAGGGISVFSPTASAPRTFQWAEDLDVPIIYKVDPTMLALPQFAQGYWVELSIIEPLMGNVVMTRTVPVPPTDFEGSMTWDGVYDDGAQPVSGQQFDIVVRLLDYLAHDVQIPGRQTLDRQSNAIRMNVSSVTIGATATRAVSYTRLLAGADGVNLPLQIDTPGTAVAPDALVLEVRDANDVVLAQLPQSGLPATIRWNGKIAGGAPIPGPGHYRLRVTAKRGASVLSRSNVHEVKVVLVDVTFVDAAEMAIGGLTVHPISDAGPAMPALVVHTVAKGLQPDEEAVQARDVRVSVSFTGGDRNDQAFFPGPAAGAWFTLAPGVQDWPVAWGGQFRGGTVTAFARVAVDGVVIEGSTPTPNVHRIHGLNPPKATIQAAYGSLNVQVVGFQESRFNQFRNTTATGSLNVYDAGPFAVLVHVDAGGTFGYGIGALTLPPPIAQQIWSWTANVAESIAHLGRDLANAQGFVAAQRAANPLVPAMTADQINLEMWSRYNTGSRAYHRVDPTTNTWVKVTPSHAGHVYADTVMAVFNQVQAGMPPVGW